MKSKSIGGSSGTEPGVGAAGQVVTGGPVLASGVRLIDRDMVLLLAEKVMGWTHRPRLSDDRFQMWEFRRPAACNIFATPHALSSGSRWWPLTEIADAFMLVDALLVKKRMWFRLSSPLPGKPGDPNWQATFQGGSVNNPNRCRAIVLACLTTLSGENVPSDTPAFPSPNTEEPHL